MLIGFQIRRVRRDAEPGHHGDAAEPDGHRRLPASRGQEVDRLPLQREDLGLQPDPGTPASGKLKLKTQFRSLKHKAVSIF